MVMKLMDFEFWWDEVEIELWRGVAVIGRRLLLEGRMAGFKYKVVAWSWQRGNNFGLM